MLTGAGELDPAIRQAIEARAAELGGRAVVAPPLPGPVAAYVEKVARHAYKTTDEDLDALKRAGYSENAIFEMTVSAALGAGLARFERGVALLKGERR